VLQLTPPLDHRIQRSNTISQVIKVPRLNLHSVWDSAIIDKAIELEYSGSRKAFEADLIRASRTPEYAEDMAHWLLCADGMNRDCTHEWGEESFEAALRWAYENADGEEVVDGSVLEDIYYETRLPIVKKRIMAAGVRLAVTLEAACHRRHIRIQSR
jgi:hypothetical protein